MTNSAAQEDVHTMSNRVANRIARARAQASVFIEVSEIVIKALFNRADLALFLFQLARIRVR